MSIAEYQQLARIAALAGWQLSDSKFQLYAEYVTVNSRQELQEIARRVIDSLGEVVSVAASVLFVSSEPLTPMIVSEYLDTCEELKKGGGIAVMGLHKDDYRGAAAANNLNELLSTKYKVHSPPRMPVMLIDSELGGKL